MVMTTHNSSYISTSLLARALCQWVDCKPNAYNIFLAIRGWTEIYNNGISGMSHLAHKHSLLNKNNDTLRYQARP